MHERRALHRAAHAEALRDAAGEGRLARAQRTGEHDEVAGAQHPADPRAERLHVSGDGDLVPPDERVESAHADTCRRGTRGPMRVTIS